MEINCYFCKKEIKPKMAYPLMERETLKELAVCEECFKQNVQQEIPEIS